LLRLHPKCVCLSLKRESLGRERVAGRLARRDELTLITQRSSRRRSDSDALPGNMIETHEHTGDFKEW
jgi:hypothetical protein